MFLFAKLITSKWGAFITVILGVALVGLVSVGVGHAKNTTASNGAIPISYESYRAAEAQAEIGAPPGSNAVIVYETKKPFTATQREQIQNKIGALSIYAPNPFLPPVQYAADNKVALQVIPLIQTDSLNVINTRVANIRAAAVADLPKSINVYVTGPEGFANDVAHVFDGADLKLLIATGVVVILLLLITYRSPILWLVPLTVVALAADVAGQLARPVAAWFGVQTDASVNGILSVLVFGAGTDYALLIISRYREELLNTGDRRAAMVKAWRAAVPAILASSATVVLALSTLGFAQINSTRALGIACAAGIVVAAGFVLIGLPAALAIFPTWIFWPLVPRVGDPNKALNGRWAKVGVAVSKKPTMVAAVGTAVLIALAFGSVGLRTGLSSTEQFVQKPSAVYGQEIIASHFGAGITSPVLVVVNKGHEAETMAAAKTVTGVQFVSQGLSGTYASEVFVTTTAAPQSEESFTIVKALRAKLHKLHGANALVGGINAGALDVRTAQLADQALLIPLILVLVFLVLLVLLRSFVAPVLLLLTVVGSFFASLGAGWLVFEHVFHFPALAGSTLLLAFLFLVALGVDYNIFLVTRAKEEAVELGSREGMIRALGTTGGVITSAGVLLAAVFAVLGVLPLIALLQVGTIVCIGVLIDTLLVRTVIVPALAFIAGDKFWWPANPNVPAKPSKIAKWLNAMFGKLVEQLTPNKAA